jgi:hypothetical protein
VSKNGNPNKGKSETKAHTHHEKKHSALIEYISDHKPGAILLGVFFFSLGGYMNFFGSNPNILYLAPIALCAVILYFSHDFISSLKADRKRGTDHTELDKQASAPLETPTPTPMKKDDRPNQSITTHGQSGGQNIIAGGDVHLGPKRREITPSQETAILAELAGAPTGKVEISVTESDLEAVALARRIESILSKAGNQVHVGLMMMMSGPMGAPVGMGVAIKDKNAIPPHAYAILQALARAGLTGEGSTNQDRDGDTLYITVGARPLDP